MTTFMKISKLPCLDFTVLKQGHNKEIKSHRLVHCSVFMPRNNGQEALLTALTANSTQYQMCHQSPALCVTNENSRILHVYTCT